MDAKSLNNKLKAVLAGTLLMLGAFFAYSAISTDSADAAACSGNSVIHCGVWSVKEMRDKYNSDYTKGTKSIYQHLGVTSDMVNNATVVKGTSYQNGEVKVNGKVVATNSYTAGRYYVKGSTKHVTKEGITFYTRSAQVSLVSQSAWETYVFLDKNGKFIGAVLLDCGNPLQAKPVEPKPQPVYACSSLSRLKQDNPNKYVFVGKSRVANGAEHKGFTFDFGDGSSTKYVAVQRTSDAGKYGYGEVAHTYSKPGTYNVKVTAHFTVNGKEVTATSDNCQKPVTIPKKEVPPAPKNPGVSIDKQVRSEQADGMTKEQALEQARNFQPKGPCTTVMTPAVHVETGARYTFTSGCLPEGWVAERNYNADNTTTNSSVSTGWVEHATVDVNNQYDYRLVIKNTGDVDLKSTEVRDAAPSGVTFIDADKGQITNNVWTYTIPELKVGQSTTVVIKAKVTEYVAGTLTNTACVDATEVPGDKDDCDDATVDVEKPPVTPPAPQPEKVKVCDLDDKSIVWVTEDQLEDNPERYTTDLSKCEEAPEAPEVPTELPQTGLGLALNGLAGIGTLTAASYYYVSSRRF